MIIANFCHICRRPRIRHRCIHTQLSSQARNAPTCGSPRCLCYVQFPFRPTLQKIHASSVSKDTGVDLLVGFLTTPPDLICLGLSQ